MATLFSCFTPTPILSSPASSNHRILQSSRRGNFIAASSNSWWTPLFGWSSDPDYIHTSTTGSAIQNNESLQSGEKQKSKSRFSPGCFTEEKAKELRMKTMETATFHDIMYHSAIASRLASEVSRRNES
ncbi:hypothetical protein LguiA_028598 [Lonicera macranthoides]